MTDPVWPEILPYPLLNNYSNSHELPLIRTDMESGPQRVTRKSKSYVTTINFSFVADMAQQEAFEEFFEHDANAGADWVMMPSDTVGGVAYHRVRITSRSSSPFGFNNKTISLTLETEDRIKGIGY